MLPIGSIFYLKEGTSKLMILNRGAVIEQDNKQLMFDYSGCIYPQGLVPDQVYYFNKENVDEVVFKGLIDSDEERFQKLYDDWMKENKSKFEKGKVEEPLI